MTALPLSATRLWQLLYQTLDRSDDIVIVLQDTAADADGAVVVAVNEAFSRATGYSDGEMFGRTLTTLAAPEVDPSVTAAMVSAIRQRRSLRTELQCIGKSGARLWLGLHLMPAAAPGDHYFIMLGRDITDSLQARQQQTAIQGLLAKVFLCVDAAVGIVSTDGRILMTNPQLDRLLGYPPNALVGRKSEDLATPGSRAKVLAARQRQHQDGVAFTINVVLLHADATEVPAQLRSVMIEQPDQKHYRIVTIKPVAPPVTPPMRVQIAGKIKLVGLEEIKSVLGDRWPAAAQRAMAVAEHIIERRCGPRDTYGRTEDNGFLICFGDATEEEAAFRAAMIARDIRTRLIGEGETPAAAHVSAIAAAVEVPDLPNQPVEALTALIEGRLTARLAQIERAARDALKASVEQATCELEAIHGHDRDEIVAQFARLPLGLQRRMYAALAALPERECREFDIDRLMLGLATEQAARGMLDGSNWPVLVTVGFEIFHARSRTERYIEACQKLDPRLRHRLIMVLAELPHGTPKSRVLDCVTRLRPFCRGIGFTADELESPPIDLAAGGVPIVVLSEEQVQVGDGTVAARLGKLIGTLHAHRARLLVRHVASWPNAQRLLSAGVDLVSFAEAGGTGLERGGMDGAPRGLSDRPG